MKSPTLVNAAEMERQHPQTFFRPTPEELASITTGSMVKVCDGGERFWVQVDLRCGDFLTGYVKSILLFSELDYDDKIKFCLDNIYEVGDFPVRKQSVLP